MRLQVESVGSVQNRVPNFIGANRGKVVDVDDSTGGSRRSGGKLSSSCERALFSRTAIPMNRSVDRRSLRLVPSPVK